MGIPVNLGITPAFTTTEARCLNFGIQKQEELHILHYANTPMQYTAIFHGCKNDNFQMKNYGVFLIFAQNIDCGYTLELPQ